MQPRLTNRLYHRTTLAASALVATTLSFAAGPASAETYVPHADLTPYQIVSDVGTCFQASNMPTPNWGWPAGTGWSLGLAACDSTNNLQKFYVLQATSVTDLVPPAPGEHGNVRIFLAAAMDVGGPLQGSSFPGYSFLVSYSTSGTPITNTADPHYTSSWGINSAAPVEWRQVADENQYFAITGSSATVAYGSSIGASVWKTFDTGSSRYMEVACSNSTFGDPQVGVPKHCFLQSTPPDSKPAGVRFGDLMYCLVRRDSGVDALGECSRSESVWTLRPTGYPR